MVNAVVPITQTKVTSRFHTNVVQLYFYHTECSICGKQALALYPEVEDVDESGPALDSVYICQECINGLFAEAAKAMLQRSR